MATQQLSFLLTASVPLLRSLVVIIDVGDDNYRNCFSRICRDVERGCSLSQALGNQPESFPPLYRRAVLSGEKTGKLSEVMGQLARQLAYQLELRRRIQSAITYPVCVSLFALGMVAFLLYVQVPGFLAMFHDSDRPLPAVTRLLLLISDPHLALLGGAALALVVGSLYRRWQTPGGREAILQRLYGLPLVGRLLALHDVSQICRELATMLNSGVELLSALSALESEDVPSPYFRSISGVIDLVKEGTSLSESLSLQGIFPPLLVVLLEVGEETGRLWDGLSWYADMAYSDLVDTIDVSLKLVEPLVMGFLGLTVTFIAIASFLPIYQLVMD